MRTTRVVLLCCVAVAALALLPAAAGAATSSSKTVWLCNPSLKKDPCRPGLATTRFSAAGLRTGVAHPHAVKRPKIDCFYVYPTVSDQKTAIANKHIDPEIKSIALYQAARYSQVCRVFAPVYRQRTVAGIQDAVNGTTTGSRRGVVNDKGYSDVLAAWRAYLKNDNNGRGVVFIGHSQGSFVLRQLLANEVDRKPAARKLMVSAVLLGGNVEVKQGSDRGGDFQNLPACRSKTQVGCVIAFSTFGATPPDNALFGRTATPGREVLCTNPASLGGGSATLDGIFPSAPFAPGTLIAAGITLLGVKQPTAPTPWVELPDSYSAECSGEAGAHVLRLTPLNGAPAFKPSPTEGWGLHLVDANIALGNLIDDVRSEAAAFAKRR
jgi:hypothetical protein